ncbi:hypothetical protein [Lihuaxuella thermophila]|uniref:Uncharacterized protein n=1 Tax=Lihuaxuella thermophila TaxID=1173111 RepID=A0A1H8J232_9BACL|nr:hypothetical protein [Lihuaxuella thermophila]SEN74731.1 hypothetical protein SAMN05444955_1216 [Lihuaxuella thermophila]
MLKLQIEGQPNQVKSFLQDIGQRPQIELIHQEVHNGGMTGQVDVSVSCYIKYLPDRRLRMLQITTMEGGEIRIPLLDVTQVEIDEGVQVVFGKYFDIFS